MRLTLAALLLLATLAAVPATVTYVREVDRVDRCLDAGGSVDYEHMICDAARTHPYSSFGERHRDLLTGTVAALCAVVVVGGVIVGSRKVRRSPWRSAD